MSDGEVPVVVVHTRPDQPPPPRPDRSAVQLEHERAARERAERALTAAQARMRDLEAKVFHVTQARDEALASLKDLRAQLAAALAPPPVATPVAPLTADAAPPMKRRRGRPPKIKTEAPAPRKREKAPQPVKWWVKGWRDTVAE